MSLNNENHPISTTEAQNNFGACLKKVLHTAQPVLVQKHGKPVAVLLDYRSWQTLVAQKPVKEDAWVAKCQKLVARIKRGRGKQTSAVELLKELRDER